MTISQLADRLLEATPDFEQVGGKVTSPEGALRGMAVEQVAPNIVLFYHPNGLPPFKAPGWIMVYFADSPAATQALKDGEIEPPMFKPGSLSMRFQGYSMIDQIWDKTKRQRWHTPDDIKKMRGKTHIVAALEAYKDEQGLYVDNLSVRPGWQRNTIGQKLMQALKNRWPDIPMTHSQPTREGRKFLKKTGGYRPEQDRDVQITGPVTVQPSKETIESIIRAVLEDDHEEKEWIGVDLDGTLAKHTEWKGPTKIGEPIPKMVRRIRRWVGHGKKVKIFTARADDERAVNAIKKWLKDHELPDLEITNLKDKLMKELWDDKAVAVEKNTGVVKEDVDFLLAELLGRLTESPDIETLKKHRSSLTPEEKAQIPKDLPTGDGATVLKAVVDGETWYACYTHRAGHVSKTLKGMLKAYPGIASTA